MLGELTAEGGDPRAIVEARGLAPIADTGELEAIVDRAIEANAAAVEQIRGGKAQAAGAIVGAVMKETKGRADGAEVNRLIREKLGAVTDNPNFWLVVAVAALIVAIWLGFQILGFVLKVVIFVAAVALALAAFRAWGEARRA